MSNLAKAMEQALKGGDETKKALSSRQADFKAKEKAKQEREAKKRAKLEAYLLSSLSEIEKNITSSEKEFESYSNALSKFVSALDQAPYTKTSDEDKKAPLKIKKSSYGQGVELLRFLRDNTDFILDGTADQTSDKRALFEEAFQAGSGQSAPHLSRALNERSIDDALSTLFKERVFKLIFELTPTQASKAQNVTPQLADRIAVSIVATPATSKPKLSISATHKIWKHHNIPSKLNAKSFAHALTYIHDWALQAFYSDAESLTKTWADMQADQALRDTHMSIYGHTRYCERKEDDLAGRQEDLKERLEFWRNKVEKQKTFAHKG